MAASIRTARLELVAATEQHLLAELEGRAHLAAALGALVPDAWPPELYGEHGTAAARWVLERMAESPADRRFFQYWFVLAEPAKARTLIGVGGFKGPPAHAAVEVGYEVLEAYRRDGFATEATAGMLGFAFAHDDVERVDAQTLPHLTPSIGVLRKCGFRFAGQGEGEGVIRFEITRGEWHATRTGGDRMETSGEWVLLQEYASLTDATLDLGVLETEEVPTMVRGLEPGIWGPGFTGNTVHGVRIFVPADLLDVARDLVGRESLEADS